MKIIYFTTAQDEKDYRSFINIWKIPLNSSNQNFHNKFIRALALENEVHVISVRPFSNSKTKVLNLKEETKVVGNITWHYLRRAGGKVFRTLTIAPQAKRVLKKIDLTDAIFMTDTINPPIVRALVSINKKYNRPIIGICTDSPSNISGTRRSYTVYLLDKCSKYNGYVALTEGLNDLFNPEHKPTFIFEGLVEERKFEKHEEKDKPYFFFGGALMKRYGVFQLIDAFKKLNREDIELHICGHHGDKAQIKDAIGDSKNIKFLGLLPVSEVMEKEHNAIASINPRPFSEDLDRYSIPSKTLEYMSTGRPVISVKNSILMDKFPTEVIWVEESNKEQLMNAMKKVLDMTEVEQENLGEQSKNRVLELYSLKSVGKRATSFLEQFIK